MVGLHLIDLADGVSGSVGLNTESRAEPGVARVNPVLGVRSDLVERWVARLKGFEYKSYGPPTVSRPLGYLLPAAQPAWWAFNAGGAGNESVADDVTASMESVGLPYMRKNTDLESMLAEAEGGWGLGLNDRRPVLLALLGRDEDAVAFVRHAVEVMDRRNPNAAEDMRSFLLELEDALPLEESP
jgi:hypothetical protein